MKADIADVCIVGVGAVGGILAKELGSAGLNVVALERGPAITLEDYAARDTIKHVTRSDLHEWVKYEPTTSRTTPNERAQIRYSTSPSNALGGALLHWTAQAARFSPGDFKVYTNEVASGVAERAGLDLTGYDVVDWPITYDDLEPYYEKFEWEMGVSGGGVPNPFGGPRRKGYPTPPLRRTARTELFEAAALKLGYHPYQSAAGILSQPYQPAAPYDSRIPERPACVYCGHCNNFGCHVQAKTATLYTAIPVALQTGKVDLRTGSKVVRIESDGAGRASGVTYIDHEGSTQHQQARVVMLAGYVFENVRLLLLSGMANSSGMVGKGFLARGDVRGFGLFDDYVINGFIGPTSAAIRCDDYNGNNFDHTGLGFIRGGGVGTSGDGSPLQRYNVLPPGMKRWGAEYKDFIAHYYTRTMEIVLQAESLAHEDNLIDLDPDVKDRWGIPVPRVTFSFHENERRMHNYMRGVVEGIMRETGANQVWSELPRGAPGQSGGTRMGSDPSKSVVSGYCQSHDVPNLFVVGASVYPTLSGYPATATLSALAYRTSEYVASQREWFR